MTGLQSISSSMDPMFMEASLFIVPSKVSRPVPSTVSRSSNIDARLVPPGAHSLLGRRTISVYLVVGNSLSSSSVKGSVSYVDLIKAPPDRVDIVLGTSFPSVLGPSGLKLPMSKSQAEFRLIADSSWTAQADEELDDTNVSHRTWGVVWVRSRWRTRWAVATRWLGFAVAGGGYGFGEDAAQPKPWMEVVGGNGTAANRERLIAESRFAANGIATNRERLVSPVCSMPSQGWKAGTNMKNGNGTRYQGVAGVELEGQKPGNNAVPSKKVGVDKKTSDNVKSGSRFAVLNEEALQEKCVKIDQNVTGRQGKVSTKKVLTEISNRKPPNKVQTNTSPNIYLAENSVNNKYLNKPFKENSSVTHSRKNGKGRISANLVGPNATSHGMEEDIEDSVVIQSLHYEIMELENTAGKVSSKSDGDIASVEQESSPARELKLNTNVVVRVHSRTVGVGAVIKDNSGIVRVALSKPVLGIFSVEVGEFPALRGLIIT
ncbi:hypothetical protein EZV62_001490 [Acer yangbiense]|uniref:Uncharacterized protein n=1 Tax=Acer yangbiense TaxID=1000413 RepID=A0A5C7IUG0_9ROSI|nr:hypothetical protein EZV62_001490 [Acer yangbiense]